MHRPRRLIGIVIAGCIAVLVGSGVAQGQGLLSPARTNEVAALAEKNDLTIDDWSTLAAAALGEHSAKNARIAEMWQLHKQRQALFSSYQSTRAFYTQTDFFGPAWARLTRGLVDRDPRAIAATTRVLQLADQAGDPNFGGWRAIAARQLLLTRADVAPPRNQEFEPPRYAVGIDRVLDAEAKLGIAEYWSGLTNEERAAINASLPELASAQAGMLQDLASDHIGRVRAVRPSDDASEIQTLPEDVQSAVSRMRQGQKSALIQGFVFASRATHDTAMRRMNDRRHHGASAEVIARALYDVYVPSSSSFTRNMRLQAQVRDGEIGLAAYTRFASVTIPEMERKEQQAKSALQKKAGSTTLIHPGKAKSDELNARYWAQLNRTTTERLLAQMSAFGLQAKDTAEGLATLATTRPDHTVKGLADAAYHWDRTVSSMFVGVEDAAADQDEIIGRAMFELTLSAVPADLAAQGVAKSATALKGAAHGARAAGDLEKAGRLARAAEKLKENAVGLAEAAKREGANAAAPAVASPPSPCVRPTPPPGATLANADGSIKRLGATAARAPHEVTAAWRVGGTPLGEKIRAGEHDPTAFIAMVRENLPPKLREEFAPELEQIQRDITRSRTQVEVKSLRHEEADAAYYPGRGGADGHNSEEVLRRSHAWGAIYFDTDTVRAWTPLEIFATLRHEARHMQMEGPYNAFATTLKTEGETVAAHAARVERLALTSEAEARLTDVDTYYRAYHATDPGDTHALFEIAEKDSIREKVFNEFYPAALSKRSPFPRGADLFNDKNMSRVITILQEDGGYRLDVEQTARRWYYP